MLLLPRQHNKLILDEGTSPSFPGSPGAMSPAYSVAESNELSDTNRDTHPVYIPRLLKCPRFHYNPCAGDLPILNARSAASHENLLSRPVRPPSPRKPSLSDGEIRPVAAAGGRCPSRSTRRPRDPCACQRRRSLPRSHTSLRRAGETGHAEPAGDPAHGLSLVAGPGGAQPPQRGQYHRRRPGCPPGRRCRQPRRRHPPRRARLGPGFLRL
jgi:hypothetical protein